MLEHVLRSDEPLQLLSRQPFGQGGKRDCFVHPHHPDRCVKVARAGCEPETLLRQSPLWRRWRKSVQDFDENYSDWRTLDALEKSDDIPVWNHVPHCFGWVDTDRGRGLTVDLIRDADGLISRSFIDYLWTHGYDEAARNGVDQLSRFWETRAIPSRSIGLHNLAAQLSPDGTLRLVLIDGFGSTEFIPWSKWSKSHAIARSRRKIEAMKAQIAVKLAQKSRGEGPGKYGFLLSRSLPSFIATLTQGMETPNLVAGLTSFC